ncbi:protein mono-ADP-ribosyltransferase PARP11 isoform X4 [Dipodomys spectabilis]|uniref:protein mono-ADP-ribosyltransferase PARP11 isoform X4 n=1 Tax=Dipodomys spectabilis TaxID=105255 RepID=UPI001C53C424|nr:protein mono-ADP-ribosyltransferase PARP11 isoform X4 [Dipodomys spectabilis]
MWEANPEMFHKAEEFLPRVADREGDAMDTSDTQWGWFYLAECGKWHMIQPDASIQCSVSSEDIEKSFRTNPCGSISFTTSKFSYKIDFAEMKQMNLSTGKQRLVKRAPFSISAFSYVCENEAIPVPSHWECVHTDVPYQLIPLHTQTHEYNEVAALFGKTMDRNRIRRIQRIQNLDLWEFFCRKKSQLKKKRGIPQINEQMLFHGTSSEFVEAICIHNFDWRINGMHGALLGKGRGLTRGLPGPLRLQEPILRETRPTRAASARTTCATATRCRSTAWARARAPRPAPAGPCSWPACSSATTSAGTPSTCAPRPRTAAT